MDCITVILSHWFPMAEEKFLQGFKKMKQYLHLVIKFVFFISSSTDPSVSPNTENLYHCSEIMTPMTAA